MIIMSNNYIITEGGELLHAGVKGMRWGVRRYQNEDGTLTEAGKRRYEKAEYRETVKNAKPNLKEATRSKPNAVRGAAKVAAGAILIDRIHTAFFTQSSRQQFASYTLGEKIANGALGATLGAMSIAALKSGMDDIKGSATKK